MSPALRRWRRAYDRVRRMRARAARLRMERSLLAVAILAVAVLPASWLSPRGALIGHLVATAVSVAVLIPGWFAYRRVLYLADRLA